MGPSGGDEIRWDSSSKHTAAIEYANDQWNSLSSVAILPDDILHVEDLRWRDFDNEGDPRLGYYDCGVSPEIIRLNDARFDDHQHDNPTLDEVAKKATTTHELGHALRLDHSFLGNVMKKSNRDQVHFGSHDLDDYYDQWGLPPCGKVTGVPDPVLLPRADDIPIICS
jgi:hypothetical protein